MEEQSVRDNVKDMEAVILYGGFSEIISSTELHEKMESGVPEFKLSGNTKYPDGKGGEDKVEVGLNFNLSEKGNYYSPSFDLAVTKADGTELHQQFKNNYGDKYTLKEAYNMLDGRSVIKDFLPIPKKDEATGERLPRPVDEDGKLKTYRAAAYLDFSDKDDDGNFRIKKMFGVDVNKILEEYPFKEKNFAQSYGDLVDSLERGNRQSVTVPNLKEPDQPDLRMYAEVNGRYRNLNIYNAELKPDRFFLSNWKQMQQAGSPAAEHTQAKDQGPEIGQAASEGQQHNRDQRNKEQVTASDDSPSEPEQRQGRKRGRKVS